MPCAQLALEALLRGLEAERLPIDGFQVTLIAENDDGQKPCCGRGHSTTHPTNPPIQNVTVAAPHPSANAAYAFINPLPF